jgi:demethylmenaquinone methyltransferase/2-methoxy-6-polyprenyl-1,4-benzoquinol methylase
MMEREYIGPDSRSIQQMFARIAHRYDFLNHFLSASIDRRWRNATAAKVRELVGAAPGLVLDACSGTGDLAIALHETLNAPVIASDFCHPMLALANGKFGGLNIRTIEADALQLPFPNACFDALTVGFGVRNLQDLYGGFLEMRRVLKPGGAAVILEFTKPVAPVFTPFFNFHIRYILPVLGRMISGDAGAYQYLPDSIRKFPDQERLRELMQNAGFVETCYRNLTGGVAALHWGRAS